MLNALIGDITCLLCIKTLFAIHRAMDSTYHHLVHCGWLSVPCWIRDTASFEVAEGVFRLAHQNRLISSRAVSYRHHWACGSVVANTDHVNGLR